MLVFLPVLVAEDISVADDGKQGQARVLCLARLQDIVPVSQSMISLQPTPPVDLQTAKERRHG